MFLSHRIGQSILQPSSDYDALLVIYHSHFYQIYKFLSVIKYFFNSILWRSIKEYMREMNCSVNDRLKECKKATSKTEFRNIWFDRKCLERIASIIETR